MLQGTAMQGGRGSALQSLAVGRQPAQDDQGEDKVQNSDHHKPDPPARSDPGNHGVRAAVTHQHAPDKAAQNCTAHVVGHDFDYVPGRPLLGNVGDNNPKDSGDDKPLQESPHN